MIIKKQKRELLVLNRGQRDGDDSQKLSSVHFHSLTKARMKHYTVMTVIGFAVI